MLGSEALDSAEPSAAPEASRVSQCTISAQSICLVAACGA